MLTYTYDVVYDIVEKPTMSYTTSQNATGKNSPPTYTIVGKQKSYTTSQVRPTMSYTM